MLSFKSIAGFLRKVSTRDSNRDGSAIAHHDDIAGERGGDALLYHHPNVPFASAPAVASSEVDRDGSADGLDVNAAAVTTSSFCVAPPGMGMPSAFIDSVLSTSDLLKNLSSKAGTQEVLRHIDVVVKDRAEALVQQASRRKSSPADEVPAAISPMSQRSGCCSRSPRGKGKGDGQRTTASDLISGTTPAVEECAGDAFSSVAGSPALGNDAPPAMSLRRVQIIRAEMVDALDICLQEIPEKEHQQANQQLSRQREVGAGKQLSQTAMFQMNETKNRPGDNSETTASGALTPTQAPSLSVFASTSAPAHSLVGLAPEQMAVPVSPPFSAEVSTLHDDGCTSHSESLLPSRDEHASNDDEYDGGGDSRRRDRRSSTLEIASSDRSTSVNVGSIPPLTPVGGPPVYTQFEWRCLQWRIVDTLAQVDRIILADVRDRYNKVICASLQLPADGPVKNNAVQQGITSSTTPQADAADGPLATADSNGSAVTTPLQLALSQLNVVDPQTPGPTSPSQKGRAAVADGSTTPSDALMTMTTTKEAKKYLEELIRVACSLATWTILKAILRVHIYHIERRYSVKLTVSRTPRGDHRGSAAPPAEQQPSDVAAEQSSEAAAKSGRPPLAPVLIPPPTTTATASERFSEADESNTMNDTIRLNWSSVVLELAELLGETHSMALAESTLCASFLRDEGREMVLCMLQQPKPRRLLEDLQHRMERVRRAPVDQFHQQRGNLAVAASPPVSTTTATPTTSATHSAADSIGTSSGSPSGPLPQTASSNARAAVSKSTPIKVMQPPALSTASITSPAASSSSSNNNMSSSSSSSLVSQGAPNVGSGAPVPPSAPTPVTPVSPSTSNTVATPVSAMLQDESMMMDDLVADLEKAYRYGVASTWCAYLEQAVLLNLGNDETSLSYQQSESTTAFERHSLASAASRSASDRVSDTRTLSCLATAFFFGSDAWSVEKKDRVFALLRRSMQSRTVRYSESAVSRRNLRRGTSVYGSNATDLQASDISGGGNATALPPKTSCDPTMAPANLSFTRLATECTVCDKGEGAADEALPPAPSQSYPMASSALSTASAVLSARSTPVLTALNIDSRGNGSGTEANLDPVGPGSSASVSKHKAQGLVEGATTWTPFRLPIDTSGRSTPTPEHRTSALPNVAGQLLDVDQSQILNVPSYTTMTVGGSVGGDGVLVRDMLFPYQVLQRGSGSNAALGPGSGPLEACVLERIVNMSWSAALHKRVEHCLAAKPPRLEEAEQVAQEERIVASIFGDFRAKQRAVTSLINARLASGKSVEALMSAQRHFRSEKKDWVSRGQTIFSALRYLQSMLFLVRSQAACRAYGAVIESAQLVIPQAALCDQMLLVLAPRPRGCFVLRFGDCRAKLLRIYIYLLKECWLAHAAFNNHAKAERFFVLCAQYLRLLRKRTREGELFEAYMERGSQLMKNKEYEHAVELFKYAVDIAKGALQAADVAAAAAAPPLANATGSVTPRGSTGGPPTTPLLLSPVAGQASSSTSHGAAASSSAFAAAPVSPSPQFHAKLHLRAAGSGSLTTAEEHVNSTFPNEDDLELPWRVAESERMLALSYVTQAEHEVNVRKRREVLSNAVSSAYNSQRALQRWQIKGGTPKRLLTAVPCSLIVICKGLLLLGQPRKGVFLLEPLIENKPSSASVRPPMWCELLVPTEDPLTAEDIVLRIYVNSVKITVYALYAQCLAEYDGERALRAVGLMEALLQEGQEWIAMIRKLLYSTRKEVLEGISKEDNEAVAAEVLSTARESGDGTAHTIDVPELVSIVGNGQRRGGDYIPGATHVSDPVATAVEDNAIRRTKQVEGEIGPPSHLAVPPSTGGTGSNIAASSTTAMLHSTANTPTSFPTPLVRIHMDSASERLTAIFALREGALQIRRAMRDACIVSGDAQALLKNWEEALKSYSHALVICASEVEQESAAARRRSTSALKQNMSAGSRTILKTSATDGGTEEHAVAEEVKLSGSVGHAVPNPSDFVASLDEEFLMWDEEDVLIADSLVDRKLSASTVAKDLRTVAADEERTHAQACENAVLRKLANVYRALSKPTTAIHYHTLVLDYANECHDKLLAYNSMLSLAQLYTTTNNAEEAREMWAKVSELAKTYEDKEVSRETKRNIVAGQEAAGMFMEVVKTAEELDKLATGEEGADAVADRRYALEALANAHLQLAQYEECLAALDSRERVQEKSAEWSGKLLSMRAKARIGLGKTAEAIKVLQTWVSKARNLSNWIELGKANAALAAAYAAENRSFLARNCYHASLQAFSLVDLITPDCRRLVQDSARWLVHYSYLEDTPIQIDPSIVWAGVRGGVNSDSEDSNGDFPFDGSHLCNGSGDLGEMLEQEEQLRRSALSMSDSHGSRQSYDDFDINDGGEDFLSNQSMFCSDPRALFDEPVAAPSEMLKSVTELEAADSFADSMLEPKDPTTVTQPPSFALPSGTLENDDSHLSYPLAEKAPVGTSVPTQDPDEDDIEVLLKTTGSAKLSASPPPLESAGTEGSKSNHTAASPAVPFAKSVSATYVPPPTSLANVSLCSRPAAAAAGTDVLEQLADLNSTGRGSSEQLTTSAGPTSTPGRSSSGATMTSAPVGSISTGAKNDRNADSPAVDTQQERRPTSVILTYHRRAMEVIESATQLLLIPFMAYRSTIPYSPAEAVDLALITNPRSMFVFYFAEYTTEYGAQCDVVIRPPEASTFVTARAQVSLKEYHNKDVLQSILNSVKMAAASASEASASNKASANSSPHPFGAAIIKASTASTAASSSSHSAVDNDAFYAAVEDDTITCLRNLYADAWQPVVDRLSRDRISYQNAETLIIMADIALLHLPFPGFLPSPVYGDTCDPLGQQFSLVVTPSLTHLIDHNMYRESKWKSAKLEVPQNYIFLPYDNASDGGVSVHPSGTTTITPSTGGGAGSHSTAAQQGAAASKPVSHAPNPSAPLPANSHADGAAAGKTAAAPAARRGSSSAVFCGLEDLPESWHIRLGCTRKELISAFTNVNTRVIMLLTDAFRGNVRVADGVVTLEDIVQQLHVAHAQMANQHASSSNTVAAVPSATVVGMNTSATSTTASPAAILPTSFPPNSAGHPPPVFCSHLDLLIMISDRSFYSTVDDPGTAARLCLQLGCHRILRVTLMHNMMLQPEHKQFMMAFLDNVEKAKRWNMQHCYALALRMTIASMRARGVGSNVWGAFTLIGVS